MTGLGGEKQSAVATPNRDKPKEEEEEEVPKCPKS